MKLDRFNQSVKLELRDYLERQISNFFPVKKQELKVLEDNLENAVSRMMHCIERVVMWKSGELDLMHSSQYAQFLQYLSNEIWTKTGDVALATKIFYLNKTMNGIDAFYEISMPRVYFIGHSQGIVLSKAQYGENLVIYQNVTIGKNRGKAPIIGNNCIIYGGSAILGGCIIGNNCVFQYGTQIIDKEVPDQMLCTGGIGKNNFFKNTNTSIEDYIVL